MSGFAPRAGSGAIRDPRDPKQVKGKMVNPPRYQKLGGLSGPSRGPQKNSMGVEKPRPGVKP